MKIRSDFVTNSSSYSSTNIIIDNPVLLEILQKYKDLGAFDDSKAHFKIGTARGDDSTKTPAFTSEIDDGKCCPDSLDSVLFEIISFIEDDLSMTGIKYDREILDQMESELREKEQEILAGYVSVKWSTGERSNEDNEPDYKGYIEDEEIF